MLLVDVETHALLDVNDAAVEQYGRSRNELHALALKDLHADDDAAALLAQITAAGDSYLEAGTWRHRTRTGATIEVAVAAHLVRFNDRPCALIAAHDLTAQRRADAAMRESEERLRQMANHIKEAFFIVDLPEWQPIYVSATWAEIWGRPMSEARDPASWIDAVHPDDRNLLAEAQAANRQGQPGVTIFRVTRPDGVLRWVRGRTFPVRDDSGAVYRVVGVAEDITDLRSAEARLAQAQKMEAVGRLAGGVAHDFNNLLTVILGEVDQLSSELDAETPEAGSVAEIRGAAERAAALTRQLLAFSRQQIIAPTVFDLTASVTGLGNMLRRLIGENIDLVMRLAPDTWNPIADPGQIEQVLANLVVNSRDAMPAGGTLTVETDNVTLDGEYPWQNADVQPGDYVVMTVSDTGTGMTPDVRARLFEPFFTTKAQGKGTGLGLATCYGILKQAGGHLSVYSEPDLGTTVKVYLPRGIRPADQPADEARPSLPRGDETILLVEDEAAVRRIAARLLQNQGYTLLQAQNGAEAADVITSHRGTIDLLLTDVVLPGMGGRQIAEQARAQRPGIRVLFTSGYTDDLILQHRLVEHHVALLPKPFSRESIARKVREVLDAPAEVAIEV
jgi:PAS domain S-box-containing protein